MIRHHNHAGAVSFAAQICRSKDKMKLIASHAHLLMLWKHPVTP
jgi:hypothetical protein